MALLDVIGRMKAAKYNGSSNAADLLAGMQVMVNGPFMGWASADIDASTDASQCVINVRDGSNSLIQQFQFATNTWTLFMANGFQATNVPDADFGALWSTITETASLIGQQTTFAAAVQTSMRSVAGAFGSYPNLVVNGLSNANFDVPIRPMMSSTAFTAVPVLTGTTALLGSLSITGLTAGAIPSSNTANKLSTVISGVTWYDRVRVNVANSGVTQLTGAALLVHVTP